jgi:endonuclease III
MFFLEVTNPTFAYFAPMIIALIALFVAVFVLMLPYLTHNLVKFIKAKTGIVVSKYQQEEFESLVASVVLEVEQKARQALKLGKDAPDGAKKLEMAVERIEEALKDLGYGDQFKGRIESTVEAVVGNLNGMITEDEKKALTKQPGLKKIGG